MKRIGLLSSALTLLAGSIGSIGYAPAPRSGPKPKGGQGADRAAKRLKAKLKANQSIPDLPVFTRQQRRALERGHAKKVRSAEKLNAMKQNLPGGAAAVL
ncbi:MAG TPA: hypothetical protein DHV74_02505 [Sulfitobacter sp.]|uniref:hypothetical protein n=1 Tax=uncultured Sulfitobacter sp. TaxID=191468 RepID=UPI000EBACCF0|nr:hypothetical protein [Sulfitobacter sp.]